MTYVLDEIINGKLQSAFAALGLDEKYAAARPSDRPDLSDFQCNGALALAKIEKKNPRAIGEEIAARLREDKDFAKVSVDGPGFLNLTLTDSFLADVADRIFPGRGGHPGFAVSSAGAGRGWILVALEFGGRPI